MDINQLLDQASKKNNVEVQDKDKSIKLDNLDLQESVIMHQASPINKK